MKQRYTVTLQAIYVDTVVVEAHSAAEAEQLALDAPDSWIEHAQDVDPAIRVVGRAVREDQ